MSRFTEVPDATVVLRHKGVYRQAKVFSLGGKLFATHGSGFVPLLTNGATSEPEVTHSELDLTQATTTKDGRLYLKD